MCVYGNETAYLSNRLFVYRELVGKLNNNIKGPVQTSFEDERGMLK